jgi:hypothetical protein
MAMQYDPKALLSNLVAELTLSILILELQIELILKEDPNVAPILERVAISHVSAREVTPSGLSSLENLT